MQTLRFATPPVLLHIYVISNYTLVSTQCCDHYNESAPHCASAAEVSPACTAPVPHLLHLPQLGNCSNIGRVAQPSPAFISEALE